MFAVTARAAVTDRRRPPTTRGPGTTRRADPQFSVVLGRFRDTVVATLHGPLDRAASVVLAGALRALMEGQDRLDLILDLADVDVIDGSGVDVLVSAARRMAARGGELSLARAGGAVAGSLATAELGTLLTPRPSSQVARTPDRARQARLASHPAGSGRFPRPEKETPRGPL